jgi:hypothetical protein
MVDPISGRNNPYLQAQMASVPKNPLDGDNTPTKQVKLDPIKHSIALSFMKEWGWPQDKALAAEQQFVKTILKQCQSILSKYKHMFKALDPNNPDNQ